MTDRSSLREIDLQQVENNGQPRRYLGLGLFALAIALGYVGMRFTQGEPPTEVGLLSTVLGGLLGGSLIGEYASPRFRTIESKFPILPSIEVLAAFSLFGVTLVTIYSGFLTVGVVSGLLLLCSFLAIMLTLS